MAEFVIGRLKFVWRNAWASSTLYRKDDVVRYGAKSYVATANHTSNADFYVDSAYWELMNDGLLWNNEWTSALVGTKIKLGDIYRYGNNLYICTTQHDSSASFDLSKFDLFVPGITWQNEWQDAYLYQVNDLVKYGNNIYICITEHTSSGDIDYSNFNLFLPGLNFEDSWDSATNYQTGDIVTYGGYTYVAEQDSLNQIPYNNTTYWKVLTTGYSYQNIWSNVTAYKTGDVVIYGGNTYVASADTTAGTLPTLTAFWDLLTEGLSFKGTWDVATQYLIGEVVVYSTNSYRAKVDTVGNQPDTSTSQWELLVQGDSNAVLTTQGDLVYHNGSQIDRLPLGSAGTTLVSDGTDVLWSSTLPTTNKTYYVAKNGLDSNNGSEALPFLTIKHACSQATDGDVVFVKQGVYEEVLPITVPAGVSLYGDSLRGCEVRPDVNSTAQTMFLLNDSVNIRNFSFKGLNGGIVMALDPAGAITNASPYIQNCTSVNANSIGIKIDGSVQASGNKSILANDFTQINSDGVGVHVSNGGRGEMVSVFTYYCDKGFFAESGGFIRALNCSSAYGEYGAVADGTLPGETPVGVVARGEQLAYVDGTLTGTLSNGDVITGNGGATATIIRTVESTQKIKVVNVQNGPFVDGETCTTNGGAGFTLIGSNAQTGQTGYLFEVEGTALQSSNAITLGSNIQFAGDTNYYTVTGITDEDTVNGYAQVRINPEQTNAQAEGNNVTITSQFSNIRLTGHDFLDIGTGDFTTTNYPNTPTQAPNQSRETDETNGGRVYYVSTDQSGNFRVGEYFKVDQATGTATLNADAFDLSGLTELQLGSIGAQLGATINEFSIDHTLAGNSDNAVPTEKATKTYVDTQLAGLSQNSISEGDTSITATDSGVGSIGITVDNTSIATINGSGITMNAGAFVGSLTGNADTVTVAGQGGPATRYVLFADATTGAVSPKTNTNFTFNPGTGELTSTIVTASSDARLKENVVGIENALDTVCKLAGVEYNRIGSDTKELGVIAQDVEEHAPQLVSTNDEGYKSVAYGNMNALILEAIKELKSEIDEIKGKL